MALKLVSLLPSGNTWILFHYGSLTFLGQLTDSLEHRSKFDLCDYAKVDLLTVTDFSCFMLSMLSTWTSVHKLITCRDIWDKRALRNKISPRKGQKFSKCIISSDLQVKSAVLKFPIADPTFRFIITLLQKLFIPLY